MTDVGFVIAAYGVTFAALGIYVATVWRRSSRARAASLRIRRGAEGAIPASAGVELDSRDEDTHRT